MLVLKVCNGVYSNLYKTRHVDVSGMDSKFGYQTCNVFVFYMASLTAVLTSVSYMSRYCI